MTFLHAHPHLHHRHRRQFLKTGAAMLSSSLATSVISGMAGTKEVIASGDKEPSSHRPYRIFDAHLHCPAESGELWQWHPVTRNFQEFVGYLDRTGVQRGIINSQRCQVKGTPAEFIAGNREVARFTEKYPGRFVGACVVNPLYVDEALKEIEYCRKQLGFVWVGELCNYMVPYQYTIKEFELLVEQVVKLGMILDVHTEQEEMGYIIDKFPQATIVFPHFGDGDEYKNIFKRIDMIAKHPNCYLDTSGYGHDRMGMLEYAVKTIGPERVLFGSDFSINCPATVIARIENSFLTEEQKRKIFAENLENLLKKYQA